MVKDSLVVNVLSVPTLAYLALLPSIFTSNISNEFNHYARRSDKSADQWIDCTKAQWHGRKRFSQWLQDQWALSLENLSCLLAEDCGRGWIKISRNISWIWLEENLNLNKCEDIKSWKSVIQGFFLQIPRCFWDSGKAGFWVLLGKSDYLTTTAWINLPTIWIHNSCTYIEYTFEYTNAYIHWTSILYNQKGK